MLFRSYHAKLKLVALVLVALLGFLLLADGAFRVGAKTVLEGQVQRTVVAPFDGFIDTAPVRAGDRVRAGQVLATLDDKDFALEQIRWRAKREQANRKLQTARAEHDRAAVAVLDAQIAQAQAQLALVEAKLARTRIVTPFDGVVVSGDLSQMLGAPVETGKVLFEVASDGVYRAALAIDERDIAYVEIGQRGKLVLSGLTDDALPIAVERVTAVATAEEGANVFRVEARIDAPPGELLQPGMEGIAKVEAGTARLWWIWTRRLEDWARIQLWKWLP